MHGKTRLCTESSVALCWSGSWDFLRESQLLAHQHTVHEPTRVNFSVTTTSVARYLKTLKDKHQRRYIIIETYDCQMNSASSEIVRAVLLKDSYMPAPTVDAADIVLINTCAMRDNAEAKVWN